MGNSMATTESITQYETGSDEIPAGSAPLFGDSPPDPFAAHNLMILSSEAHQRLRGDEPATFEREFSLRQPGLEGRLEVTPTDTPGVVHLHADVRWSESGAASEGVVHMDADVRESWLAQAAGGRASAPVDGAGDGGWGWRGVVAARSPCLLSSTQAIHFLREKCFCVVNAF